MTDEIQRLLKAFLSDDNDCTYRRIIVRETKNGGFLEPAIIKATEFTFLSSHPLNSGLTK
jgi:hypothetical protein